ncbi:hypothetical protein HA402_012478 [Bradysia odoriphaga]|nr:hypothetical protein HA402_012478 [Bradysia odoriphaga]
MEIDSLSQSVAKQKKKQKKKTKTISNERTAEDTAKETSQPKQESEEKLQQLTECLRISDCEILTNGDSEKHNNNVNCADQSCTDAQNSCNSQSEINVDETINLNKENHTEPTHSNSIETVCNGIAHTSPSHEMPSTSFACTQIEPMATASADSTGNSVNNPIPEQQDIVYKVYESELQMPDIMRLIQKDLSEPYSIYTYRYFIHNWPKLCFLAMHGTTCVGAIVCKLDIHRQQSKRGYIAMLAVDKDYRKLKIGTNLVAKAIQAMLVYNADEVVLETEITNIPALRLYENLGFVRDKRLFGYYLNGVDALRLKLWFR